MATATADKKGMKRICPSCSTRFYDFNKRPIVCPNCKVEFTGEIKVKIRRARTAAVDVVEDDQTDDAPVADKVEDDDIIMEGDDVVSLDDVDEDDADEDEDDDAVEDPDMVMDEDDLDDLDDEDEDDEDDDFDDEDDIDDEDEDGEDGDAKPKKKPGKKR